MNWLTEIAKIIVILVVILISSKLIYNEFFQKRIIKMKEEKVNEITRLATTAA
jgi:hypothetical protein